METSHSGNICIYILLCTYSTSAQQSQPCFSSNGLHMSSEFRSGTSNPVEGMDGITKGSSVCSVQVQFLPCFLYPGA
jgi:hypothetical protein